MPWKLSSDLLHMIAHNLGSIINYKSHDAFHPQTIVDPLTSFLGSQLHPQNPPYPTVLVLRMVSNACEKSFSMFFNYPLFFLTLLLPLVIRAYPAVPENGAGTGKTSLSIWPPEDSMQQNRPVKLLRQQNNSPPQNKTSKVKSSGYHCGPVAQYYGQTADDWKAANVNEWLDNWWTDHSSDIQANSNGFAGAFGEWALGNPHWSCQNDGSDSACDFSPCDNPVLNCKEDDIEPTYYVLESLTRLNSYFTGLGEAFEVSSLGAALGKDSWATKFYKDKDQKSVKALRQVINAVMTVVGVAAAGAKAGGDGI